MSQKRRKRSDNNNESNQLAKRPRADQRQGRVKLGKMKTDFDYISKLDYITIGKFTFVRPYVFEFKCHFKPRWGNRRIFDVFVDEFQHADESYWASEFSQGRVLCNGERIGRHERWTEGKQVVHIVHRHESAVFSPHEKINVVIDNENYLVVSKPSSMPVHPCGTYRRNCLQFLLRAQYGYEKLLCVHRLDKETSGLVILAKNALYAKKFSEEIKNHQVEKTYFAEVLGMFPRNITTCTKRLHWNNRTMKTSILEDENITDPTDGMDAKTLFRVISRNRKRDTTVVECRPVTGRTHQIRVHLEYLGFPIVNDLLYNKNNKNTSTKLGTIKNESNEPMNQKLSQFNIDDTAFIENDDVQDEEKRPTRKLCEWSKRMEQQHERLLTSKEEGKLLNCSNCPQVTNVKNVDMSNMFIHLHALNYKSESWSFEVPLPLWMQQTKGFINVENEKDDDEFMAHYSSSSPAILWKGLCNIS